MLVETKEAKIRFIETKNINESLDNDENLRKQLEKRFKDMGYHRYKDRYGVLVEKIGKTFTTQYVTIGDNAYKELDKMFEEDKKNAEKGNRQLSIFTIHIESI